MNTVMQITVFKNSETDTRAILEDMKACIENMDALFDVNDPDSDISKINNASAGDVISVDTHTAQILTKALDAYQYTNGIFDIRLLPIISLWGFDNGLYGVPDDVDISAALESISQGSFVVDTVNNTVTKTGDTKLALGGIAKGYLGDVLLRMAQEENVVAIINLGGNIILAGDKPDGKPWSVGVKNPLDEENLACSFESGGNRSVVTSGAYERYFEYGGQSYHHIIDPATGYPADSDLLSVTVIGEDGSVCDALSTALFVAGKEKAIELMDTLDSFEFILITESNELLYTSGVQNVELSSDAYTLREIQR